MLFSLLKHYLDTDTALTVSQSVYCFTTSISHGVENYFPRLWGTGISDAIFIFSLNDLQCFQASWVVDITHDNVFSCLQSAYFSIVPLSPFTGLPISYFL